MSKPTCKSIGRNGNAFKSIIIEAVANVLRQSEDVDGGELEFIDKALNTDTNEALLKLASKYVDIE